MKLKLEGMALYLIGADGHYLQRPKKLDETVLFPVSRLEVIAVGGPGGPVRAQIGAVPHGIEGKPPLPERLLGVVVSAGAAAKPLRRARYRTPTRTSREVPQDDPNRAPRRAGRVSDG